MLKFMNYDTLNFNMIFSWGVAFDYRFLLSICRVSMYLTHLEFRLIKCRKQVDLLPYSTRRKHFIPYFPISFSRLYASQLYIAITRRRMQENVTVWVTEQQKLSVNFCFMKYQLYVQENNNWIASILIISSIIMVKEGVV